MAEWSKAPVLKTGDVKASVGSNPTLSARYPYLRKYPSGRRGSPAKGVGGQKPREGSNPSFRAILTKRYRCVWRKARRINRFRAFSGPDFFFQTIDANRCFRASAPIRTGHFPFSGRCVQPAPFFSGVFPAGSGIFLKKES